MSLAVSILSQAKIKLQIEVSDTLWKQSDNTAYHTLILTRFEIVFSKEMSGLIEFFYFISLIIC